MAGIGATGSVGAYAAQSDYSKSTKTKKPEVFGTPDKTAGTTGTGKTSETAQTRGKTEDYGRTIGQPELSEKAAKYYEQLKKRYGNYDFILVSRDQKENAKANAAKYANGYKTVVLIDEDKIEQMATDEKFRKQYEGILSGAAAQIQQLKTSLQSSGAQVKGFGMQVNDGGTLSFFAVLKKSSAEQKARIEKKAEQKKTEKKAAEKKAAKKEKEERLKDKKSDKVADSKEEAGTEDTVTISAGSTHGVTVCRPQANGRSARTLTSEGKVMLYDFYGEVRRCLRERQYRFAAGIFRRKEDAEQSEEYLRSKK